MGNSCNRCDDTKRAFGLAWTSWRSPANRDQAKMTLKRMGCLYCMAFFFLGKFVCLALLFALPSVMVGMGAFYFHDCPRAPIIPIFLIILDLIAAETCNRILLLFYLLGCYGIVETVIYILRSFVLCDRCEIPLFVWEFSKCIVFGFFIWGSVGIFEIYEPNYDRDSGKYCDKTLYLFAFSIVTILWIFLVLFFLMCLLFIGLLACAKDEIAEEEQAQPVNYRHGERTH